jgi:lipopolysaccharide transport system permease protein
MGWNTAERADERRGRVYGASAVAGELRPSSPPSKPLLVIEPSGSWARLNLRDVWEHRELLSFLIWRELKVRYKHTLLGAIWVIIQPFFMALIFTLFFGILVRVPSDGVPYPLFVYAGFFLWAFFSNAVIGSSSSVIANSNLITKIYFPRMLIPLAIVGARLVDFVIAFLVLVGLTAYYEVAPTQNILVLPVLIAMTMLLALGVGMLTSALNVKYRDVGVALPVLMQFWMFASPIIYPMSLVPPAWQWLYALNPLVGIIENFRAAMFGLPFNWTALTVSAVAALAMPVCSAYIFRRVEKSFADII